MRCPPRSQGLRAAAGTEAGSLALRLVTFNVRYATSTPVVGEEPWRVRCPKLCSQLRFVTTGHNTAFVCLQEVLYQQALDVRDQLSQGGDGDEWAYIGRGRDDGKHAGEFSPIFYRPHVWRCERSHVYWLSETPEKPSRGWDAVLNRVVTVGLFRHHDTGSPVVVMSTHFDHMGVKARQESAKLILTIAKAWQHGADDSPDDHILAWRNGRHLGVDHEKRYGNDEITYTSFGEPGETPKRIDFLFIKDTNGVRFRTFGVLSNRFDDGVFLSDHRAVVADVDIPTSASE